MARYGEKQGGLLAGGIAYSALFSLAATLTISFSVLAAVAGGNVELRTAVVDAVNGWLPGLLDDGRTAGIVSVEQVVRSNVVSWVGIVGAVVLVFSALGLMGAVRSGVRAMFGLDHAGENAILGTLAALGGFALVGATVLASAVIGIVTSTASRWVGTQFGLRDAEGMVAWIGAGASFLLDAAMIMVLFRWVAGARPRARDLVLGSCGAALAVGVVRHLGTRVVAHSTANAVLAGFASLATLLVWINLIARIMLYAAAWTAASHPSSRGFGSRNRR
ncbi:MAG: YihY/virulence factor BrkB family protein, partial [Bifidobacteriaceae bacterium]|nr:YihY/virulence factor BrkB family protein [Bifidobacteriaceae bacterium]